jgi:uncharacterized protein YaaN involved in tellurite resistance
MMAREKMTEEEKAKRKAYKDSEAGLAEELAKLNAKQAELSAKLAIKKFPALESAIGSIGSFIQEIVKCDAALDRGAEGNLAKQRDATEKQIEFYTNKIEQLRETLANLDESRIIGELKTNRAEAMLNLKRAVNASQEDFDKSGLNDLTVVIPTIQPYLEELDSIEIPAEG